MFFPLGRGGFRLTSGGIPLDRGGDSARPQGFPLDSGGLFKFGSFENRKGAAKPRPLCTPLGLFFSSARDSLFLFVDLCLYASVFSALRCADVVLFLHFLRDSLLARSLYSSIFSALRVAISRFESQARGGRLLVVTLAEPPSAR